MIEAHAHLAYALQGAGLLYAVLWFGKGSNVHGWYVGSRDGTPEASYFVLPDYYAVKPAVLYRSVEDDLRGPWVQVTQRGESELPHTPPVPEALCHELARLQDEFIRHWLFFDDDPDGETQARALSERELPVRHVNIRASRLSKLLTAPAVWRYDAPGADQNVLFTGLAPGRAAGHLTQEPRAIGARVIAFLGPDTQAPVDPDSIPMLPVCVRLRGLSRMPLRPTLIERNLAIRAHRTMGLAPGGLR